MKLKHTFLAAMLLSPLTLAATTSGQTDVSRQESTQRADSAQQNLQQQAGQWGLSADDYQRYQQLMKGPRGTQSPGLDPLSTLGIEAQTPAERRKFAEKWVKEEFARTQKELDFQREVNAAWQRLYRHCRLHRNRGEQLPAVIAGCMDHFFHPVECSVCALALTGGCPALPLPFLQGSRCREGNVYPYSRR